MGSFSGTCEIVEATDEMTSVQHSEGFYPQRTRDSKGLPPVIRKGSKNSLEDDINKLFEAISLKNSSKGLGLSEQVGASPSRKNTSKRPMRVGASHQSQEIGFSEPVSLKQALRGLCISQAAEMAAVRRLSKPTASPRLSEAGKITSLYRSVVVEAGENGLPLAEGRVEISLMPEASTSHSSPQRLQEPKMKSADQSVCSSPRFNARTTLKSSQSTNLNEILPASAEVSLTPEASTSHSSPQQLQEPKMKSADQSVCSSPRFNATTTLKSSQSTNQNNILPASAELSLMPEASTSHSSPQQLQEPKMKSADQSVCSSPRFNAMRTLKISQSTKQNEILPESAEADSQLSNIAPTLEEKHTSSTSLPHLSDAIEAEAEAEDVGSSTKVCGSQDEFANKVAPKQRRKGRLEAVPSPSTASNNNKAGKRTRNTPRVVKPVVRTKNFVKKKPKQDSNRISSTCGENSSDFSLSTGELICQRCQCALKNTGKESHQLATSASTGVEVSSSNRNLNGINTGFTSKGCDSSSSVVKIIQNSNPREKGEFTQSSKSSIGEHSSSTSLSEESNLSGSTYGNRPHMSKDFRWEAIHHVKKQQGFLGLIHFNLLKKLGSGDIGTVYLAELSGTNCLFAIKVMDNEFLAKRKKMPRAQTEREILRMLDHPFLPTLYAQFVSDNLSCLVMDYCPGGDLHVLRQRQPCRYFPEQAARFYVAEVLLALEYLHMLGIVYRDLKPENILVREDGHIMLTDFDLSLRCSVSPTLLKSPPLTMEPPRISGPCTGSSCIDPFCSGPSCQVSCFSPRLFPTTAAAAKTRKHKLDLAAQARARSLPLLVAEPTEARSNSFVGTHEYLAPEIIKGEGHGSAVDWWTFGIFLYELLYGKTPFKGPGNEETLANVVLQSLKFPDTPIVSFQARDLIRGLLVKEPENRFGSERGAAEIKQHPFFEGLNWALIRCTIPPEIPDPVDFGAPKLESRDMLEFELF